MFLDYTRSGREWRDAGGGERGFGEGIELPRTFIALALRRAKVPAHARTALWVVRPFLYPQRSSFTSWMRLPQVSFAIAMVDPVTLVGSMVKFAPFAVIRSNSC